MSKRRAILGRIRCCGRLGDEQEARRLYLVYGVNFREYRRAYKAGRREFQKMRAIQKSTQTAIRPPDIYNSFIFNGTFVDTSWERFVEQAIAEKGIN